MNTYYREIKGCFLVSVPHNHAWARAVFSCSLINLTPTKSCMDHHHPIYTVPNYHQVFVTSTCSLLNWQVLLNSGCSSCMRDCDTGHSQLLLLRIQSRMHGARHLAMHKNGGCLCTCPLYYIVLTSWTNLPCTMLYIMQLCMIISRIYMHMFTHLS